MRFTLLLLLSLISLSVQLTNKEAQTCFSEAVNSNKCSKPLSECYSNAECEKEVGSFPCDFMENENLFNGYCFKHWQDNSALSRNLITCLINECDLTHNSKYNMTQFFECNSEVIHSIKGLECDQKCYDELTIVMQCMQQNPVEVCYAGEKTNQEANKIVKAIREVCLEGKSIKELQAETQPVEGELWRRESNIYELSWMIFVYF